MSEEGKRYEAHVASVMLTGDEEGTGVITRRLVGAFKTREEAIAALREQRGVVKEVKDTQTGEVERVRL